MTRDDPRLEGLTAAVYRFPTDRPEADGTLTWDATTAVAVTLRAGGRTGVGWTYGAPAAATVIADHLAEALHGLRVWDIAAGWSAMHRACRNIGTRGVTMMAISAVDVAWWDLKARMLGVPLTTLFGQCREAVPVYGSGGFTTLDDAQLAEQVAGWQAAGTTSLKIKIGEAGGTRIDRDLARVARLRELAGDSAQLMVDANGGYTVGQARRVGGWLDDLGVTWFEEPVSSDDLAGLAAVRAAVRCDVAAGEYAADLYDVQALLPVVDCVQLDVTRCGGYTGWLRAAALAQARNLEVSAHCAPALHAPVAAAVPNLRHVEWFADHARLEPLLADGVPPVAAGALQLADRDAGHGLTLAAGAERWRVG
ncbi:enolase C-terminal domain-like protein [Pseudofrankia inefficax]|uniref:Mandelate racemase/muconate lactonizing protein n=1 Tax=Pseudofrankia inefficax (strain DSM 45817 / CECT 9037 / DDB 130130 / EuI1c) TaxID=298654 RepID=E3J8I4_PSEI1|nr:enolase C-terminal domain-like protein [Pseudofrankia inefficax]ADP84518.1 Mandelate racemase/muconate lactonizing protein [Pseudofrankia inefficax]